MEDDFDTDEGEVYSIKNHIGLTRYDIYKDDYVPVTQQWVTEIQNKVLQLVIENKKLKDTNAMLEEMLKAK